MVIDAHQKKEQRQMGSTYEGMFLPVEVRNSISPNMLKQNQEQYKM